MSRSRVVLGISLALFLVLLAGLVWFVLTLQQRNQSVAETRDQLEADTAVMRSLEQIRRSVISSEEEQVELASYFVSNATLPAFLGDLETMAEATSVSLSVTGVVGGSESMLSTTMRARGRFEDIHHYIALVEYAPYRLQIRRLIMQYAPSNDPADPGPWTAEMELVLQSYESVM